MPFKYLEDVATADVAFEATGKAVEDVFESCAQAIFETQANVDKITGDVKKTIDLEDSDIKQLLYDFLSELVYINDTESLIFREARVVIKHNGDYKLTATLIGDKIDYDRHELGNDIKAVTMHMFELKEEKDIWRAHVIVDI